MAASIDTELSLPRLPGTGAEVAAIAQIAGKAAVLESTGFGATQRAVLALNPGSIDVLHLATHAQLDTQVPQFASLVFSRWDKSGAHVSGNLRVRDVLGIRAEPGLVVLSACDAAAEPSTAAAGLLNLTRAFLAARTGYVVASLWPVSDASAVALMSEFYRALITNHLAPDEALAAAQKKLSASGKWAAPFYWAGFVVASAAP